MNFEAFQLGFEKNAFGLPDISAGIRSVKGEAGRKVDSFFENFKDPKYTQETALPILNKILSHNTGTTLTGTAAGGIAGALYPGAESKKDRTWKNRIKQILTGMGIGGATGYGISKITPETSKAINEFMVKNTLRKPFGRIFNNIVTPQGYGNEGESAGGKFDNSFFQSNKFWNNTTNKPAYLPFLKEVAKAGLKDEPAPWEVKQNTDGTSSWNNVPERRGVSRKMWDLPMRDIDRIGMNTVYPEDSKVFKQPGSSAISIIPGKSNSWKINRFTPEGINYENKVYRDYGMDNDQYQEFLNNSKEKGPLLYDASGLMGNYTPYKKWNSDGSKVLGVDDTWDFGLHSNESLTSQNGSKINWIRYLVNKIINPQTVKDEAPIDKAYFPPINNTVAL